jgi:hypothetical protein
MTSSEPEVDASGPVLEWCHNWNAPRCLHASLVTQRVACSNGRIGGGGHLGGDRRHVWYTILPRTL